MTTDVNQTSVCPRFRLQGAKPEPETFPSEDRGGSDEGSSLRGSCPAGRFCRRRGILFDVTVRTECGHLLDRDVHVVTDRRRILAAHVSPVGFLGEEPPDHEFDSRPTGRCRCRSQQHPGRPVLGPGSGVDLLRTRREDQGPLGGRPVAASFDPGRLLSEPSASRLPRCRFVLRVPTISRRRVDGLCGRQHRPQHPVPRHHSRFGAQSVGMAGGQLPTERRVGACPAGNAVTNLLGLSRSQRERW